MIDQPLELFDRHAGQRAMHTKALEKRDLVRRWLSVMASHRLKILVDHAHGRRAFADRRGDALP